MIFDAMPVLDDPEIPAPAMNFTNDSIFIPEEERMLYLGRLRDETNLRNIPTFIFLILVAILGMFGNSLILLVYSRQMNKTATIVFIQSIAVVDLITNIIVIPLKIYVRFHTWSFADAVICKCYHFINLSTATVTVLLLLAVAIVRYRKVCVPLGWQVTTRQAQIAILAIALGSSLAIIPYPIVYGIQIIPTDRAGINNMACEADHRYVNTIWPRIVSGISLFTFIACCVPLTILYTQVGVTAWRHGNDLKRTHVNEFSAPQDSQKDVDDENCQSLDPDTRTRRFDSASRIFNSFKSNRQTRRSKQTVSKSSIQSERLVAIGRKLANHTTRMLVTISIVYIVTNLTTLVLVLIRSLSPHQVKRLGVASDSVYRLFLQIFMINSAANPFIYCMCDRNFKNESMALLKRIWTRITHQSS